MATMTSNNATDFNNIEERLKSDERGETLRALVSQIKMEALRIDHLQRRGIDRTMFEQVDNYLGALGACEKVMTKYWRGIHKAKKTPTI